MADWNLYNYFLTHDTQYSDLFVHPRTRLAAGKRHVELVVAGKAKVHLSIKHYRSLCPLKRHTEHLCVDKEETSTAL